MLLNCWPKAEHKGERGKFRILKFKLKKMDVKKRYPTFDSHDQPSVVLTDDKMMMMMLMKHQ